MLVDAACEINRRGILQKVIGVDDCALMRTRMLQKFLASTELDCSGRTDRCARRTKIVGAAAGAQITFDRMMRLVIVTDGAVRTGQGTLTATCAALRVDRDNAGLRIF